jgi:hypothetical protein
MDSRGDPAVILDDLPFGIGRSYQTLGGDFDLQAWPQFGKSILDAWINLERQGRPTLFVIAKHYSKSNNDRLGCKGHGFDLKAAKLASQRLKNQFDAVFGSNPMVSTICVLVDTAGDGITFWGDTGEMFDLAETENVSEEFIHYHLEQIYPRINKTILTDLVDLALRNIRHIAKVRASGRSPAELDHRETIIFIGQSPEAVCENASALIISPFDPDLPRVVRTAGSIIVDNITKRAVDPRGGIVVATAVPYRPDECSHIVQVRKNMAWLHAADLGQKSLGVLHQYFPSIRQYLHHLTAIISMETMLMEACD